MKYFRNFVINNRGLFIFFLQVFIVVGAFFLAFALRFDFNFNRIEGSDLFSKWIMPLLIIKLGVFWKFGLFRGWWRYVSMADLIAIFKANVFGSLGFVLFVVFVHRLGNFPRTVLLLDWVFCFLMMGGVRFLTRAFRENYLPLSLQNLRDKSLALIVGAGNAGQMIVREIRQNSRLSIEIVGFVDDDPEKTGQRFQGVPVLGCQEDIPLICRNHRIEEVIIAIPSAPGNVIRRIVERCLEANVKFKTLPGVGDLIGGRISVQSIKEVEVEDLLGRDAVRLDADKIRAYLGGKRVLITGAGGSIGSEICRQVARFSPGKIILFENSETPMFHIEQELLKNFPEIRLAAIVGDIRNRARVEAIFDEFMPEVVFHAAAYKHVPMMEHNPAEAVNNNIRGTKIVADAAHEFGVRNFVLISTDKAVNPTNIMGATKRAAEMYVQALSRKSRTHFVTVRFGNVLGSNGSVIPTFKEQIKKGGPVTVTHPEVTRFFMTIPEASQLVLQAGSMGRGGEIFLLDMGEPVKIVHLAEELIRLSGLRPYEDIDITFTGLRPGEKLYEELLLSGEGTVPTSHEKIMVARAAVQDEKVLHQRLDELFRSARAMDLASTVSLLKEIVPEYRQAVHPPPGKVYLHPALRKDFAVSSEAG